MTITKADLKDSDILDAYELGSDGTVVYLTTTVVSTNNGTSTVVVNLPADGEGLLTSRDHPLEVGDKATITGTSGGLGDGTFTVASVVDDTTFTVSEAIGTSTGGSVDFKYPVAASKLGFDPSGQSLTSATKLQQAVTDIANAVISEAAHEALDTLVHEIDGTSYEEFTYTGADITNATIWTSVAKILKIREEQYTYDSNHRATQVITIQYDAAGVEKMRTVDDYTYLPNGRVASVQKTKTGSP